MLTYTTTHNGAFLTIHREDGKTVFLQGDDAVEVGAALDACETDEQEQLILDAYADLFEE